MTFPSLVMRGAVINWRFFIFWLTQMFVPVGIVVWQIGVNYVSLHIRPLQFHLLNRHIFRVGNLDRCG